MMINLNHIQLNAENVLYVRIDFKKNLHMIVFSESR